MAYRIEITEGREYGDTFWFRPARIKSREHREIRWNDTEYLSDGFTVDECSTESFLFCFLRKFFNKKLPFNALRTDSWGQIDHFEPFLTDNFYTYETAYLMAADMRRAAKLLESDYNNPELDEIKRDFSIYCMCEENHPDYMNGCRDAVEKHKKVVIDFYERFADRLEKLMQDNPEAFLISAEGP